MPRHAFSRWSLCIACSLFIVLSFPIPGLAAARKDTAHRILHQRASVSSDTYSWQIVPSPNVGTVGSQLSSMAAVSATDIWAVGYDYTNVYSNRTLAEHWNGSQWSVVPSPNVGSDVNYLYGVSALATNNIWAVGFYRNDVLRTLVEHWDGSKWSIIPSPNVGSSDNQLEAVVALSANNIWATGTYFNPQNPHANLTLVEHWNGSKWSVVPSPNTHETINDLVAVAAISANNIWAVGYGETPGYITLVEHWNGSKWSIVKSPNAPHGNNTLQGLSVLAANNIWAVGFYYDNKHNRDKTLVEHWNGTAWSIINSPDKGSDFDRLLAVTAISPTDIWAVGDDMSSEASYQNTGTFTLIEHWNGTSWQIVKSPRPSISFSSLAATLTISGTVWAVGYYYNNQDKYYETLVERYG